MTVLPESIGLMAPETVIGSPSTISNDDIEHVIALESLVTVMVIERVPLAPSSSVTVSLTVYALGSSYLWLGSLSLDVEPSSKFHEYDNVFLSGSSD